MKYLLMMAALLASPVCVGESMSKTELDTTLQYAGGALVFIDYIQTHQIRSDHTIEEGGEYSRRFLGPEPSARKVNQWFAIQGLGFWVVQEFLPINQRIVLNSVLTLTRSFIVLDNQRVGLKLEFTGKF